MKLTFYEPPSIKGVSLRKTNINAYQYQFISYTHVETVVLIEKKL